VYNTALVSIGLCTSYESFYFCTHSYYYVDIIYISRNGGDGKDEEHTTTQERLVETSKQI